jgi:hypothetical protein
MMQELFKGDYEKVWGKCVYEVRGTGGRLSVPPYEWGMA